MDKGLPIVENSKDKKGSDGLDKGMPEKAGSCRCHLEVTRNQSTRV